MDFVDESKTLHSEKERNNDYWPGAFDPTHNDTKRHFAMLESALPILKSCGQPSILTIGDNKARDAAFCKRMLGSYAVASDLDTFKLKKAQEDGWVDMVVDIDVEHIAFPDQYFDFVVAKETFHHWPRPFLGVYEMLRVCRRGIILIEPNDCQAGPPTVYLEDGQFRDNYEEVGNYKYLVSLREILKVSWAMYLPAVVAKGFNDPWRPGIPYDEWAQTKLRLDGKGERGERQFDLMTIGVFKSIEAKTLNELAKTYRIYRRPPNPWRT